MPSAVEEFSKSEPCVVMDKLGRIMQILDCEMRFTASRVVKIIIRKLGAKPFVIKVIFLGDIKTSYINI